MTNTEPLKIELSRTYRLRRLSSYAATAGFAWLSSGLISWLVNGLRLPAGFIIGWIGALIATGLLFAWRFRREKQLPPAVIVTEKELIWPRIWVRRRIPLASIKRLRLLGQPSRRFAIIVLNSGWGIAVDPGGFRAGDYEQFIKAVEGIAELNAAGGEERWICLPKLSAWLSALRPVRWRLLSQRQSRIDRYWYGCRRVGWLDVEKINERQTHE